MNGRITASHANSQKLYDFFGYGEKPRHGFERTAHEVRVETGYDHALTHVGQLYAAFNYRFAEELSFVDADHLGAWRDLREDLIAIFHQLGIQLQPGMRNDAALGITLV